ncbi:ABC transporter permease [Rhodococcus sp. NPDC056960]|uniref:ABC transporter permease n=1 Tax=Rhodococcus sp. NPDC056960 TaxID=3345982 RepID=UPI0036409EC1
MAMLSSSSTDRPGPRTIMSLILGIAVLLALMIMAFALPASNSAPHHVPVGVVAPSVQAQQLARGLDGFEVSEYSDAAAAREAIEHRDIYGAVVVDGRNVTSIVASAASPTVAALIPTIGDRVAQSVGGTARVEDIRAFPADDPRGAGLAAGALPLALGGWIGAMAIMLLIATPGARLLAAAGVAIVGGLALVATLQYVIGTFDGSYCTTSLAAVLGIAATCITVLGLRELLGGAGLGVAAVLLIFLGNPLSGLSSAPEMLPTPWGSVGQLLPPGATGSLLRDVAFFNGHGAATPVIVLLCWLFVGVALYLTGISRSRRDNQTDDDVVHFGRRSVPDAEAIALPHRPLRHTIDPPSEPTQPPDHSAVSDLDFLEQEFTAEQDAAPTGSAEWGRARHQAPADQQQPFAGLSADARDRLLTMLLPTPEETLAAIDEAERIRNEVNRLRDDLNATLVDFDTVWDRLRELGLSEHQVAGVLGDGHVPGHGIRIR